MIVNPLNIGLLESVCERVERKQLQFHEYNFLKDEQLLVFFKNKCEKEISNEDSLSFVAIKDGKSVGFIAASKDSFDSDIFGFGCYRIFELIVFSNILTEVEFIIYNLISELERAVSNKTKQFYISFSLNNNIENSDQIFNSLVKQNYYYIHTLLTFSSEEYTDIVISDSPEQNLKIRLVKDSDVNAVANLAQKSFKYSRFHLDPFLDNEKAGLLLKTSAVNSILKGFADVMFIAEIEGKVVGYYSAKKRAISEFNKTIGEAIISAVDSDYRGIGIFSILDSHLLKWFSNNTDFAEMGTYLVNYPVHKTWINRKLDLKRGMHQFSKIYK